MQVGQSSNAASMNREPKFGKGLEIAERDIQRTLNRVRVARRVCTTVELRREKQASRFVSSLLNNY